MVKWYASGLSAITIRYESMMTYSGVSPVFLSLITMKIISAQIFDICEVSVESI